MNDILQPRDHDSREQSSEPRLGEDLGADDAEKRDRNPITTKQAIYERVHPKKRTRPLPEWARPEMTYTPPEAVGMRYVAIAVIVR